MEVYFKPWLLKTLDKKYQNRYTIFKVESRLKFLKLFGKFRLDKVYQNRYFYIVPPIKKIIIAKFYKNDRGKMPVREWILGFSRDDRKIIGEDIKTVELGWPIEMPWVRAMGGKLWEVRSTLSDSSRARILFTIFKNQMVLLHGFIKTTRKTEKRDLNLAKQRMKKFFE